MEKDTTTNQPRVMTPRAIRPSVSNGRANCPGVEWVYPAHEVGELVNEDVDEAVDSNDLHSSESNITHQVDPSTVYVIPNVDGRIIQHEEFHCDQCNVCGRKRITQQFLICVALVTLIIAPIITIKKKPYQRMKLFPQHIHQFLFSHHPYHHIYHIMRH